MSLRHMPPVKVRQAQDLASQSEVYVPQMVQVFFPGTIPGVPVFFPDFSPIQPTFYIEDNNF